MNGIFNRLVALFSSYGLNCVVLLWLFVLTLLGTLEHCNTELSLYEAQAKYFDSFFFRDLYIPTKLVFPSMDEPRIGLPLPGGQLALAVLFVNLMVGGMFRLRKRRATLGIFITHIGIAVMLLAGFVKYYWADDGHLTMYEGERAAEFESYYEWQVSVTRLLDDGRVRECVIDGSEFADMTPGESRTFRLAGLPFDLVLSNFMGNCEPRPKGPMFEVSVPVVDGFFLRELRNELDAEFNVAGAYATVVEKESGERHEALLWGATYQRQKGTSTAARNPHVLDVDGVPWGIELLHKRYPMPYSIHLQNFTHDVHPGTDKPSNFQSDVVRADESGEQMVVIRMNEPYREDGLVLFQSKFGPTNAKPGDKMFSVFSVSRNASDHWPLVSCCIIALGLLIHFVMKLRKYMEKQAREAV